MVTLDLNLPILVHILCLCIRSKLRKYCADFLKKNWSNFSAEQTNSPYAILVKLLFPSKCRLFASLLRRKKKKRVNEINIYEMCNQAPKCSRYEVCASIQTSDTVIVKETGVY